MLCVAVSRSGSGSSKAREVFTQPSSSASVTSLSPTPCGACSLRSTSSPRAIAWCSSGGTGRDTGGVGMVTVGTTIVLSFLSSLLFPFTLLVLMLVSLFLSTAARGPLPFSCGDKSPGFCGGQRRVSFFLRWPCTSVSRAHDRLGLL